MELCSVKDTPRVKPNQVLFKQNTWRKWMGFLLTITGSVLLIWFASEGGYTSQKINLPPFILYWTGGVAGLFSLILLFHAKASMRPSNWLARYSSDQLIIKLRSHLNDHFSDEDRVVAIIPVREIDWVRTYRETLSMPTSDQISRGNSEELETRNYLELKLDEKVDLTPLDDELRAERNRIPPKIGISRTKHKHYPVTLYKDLHTMRLDWTGISPGLKRALRTLARNISLKPDHTYKTPHWNGLEGKDLEDRILHLIARGKTLKAISLVKIGYSYDTNEAKLFVDDLA